MAEYWFYSSIEPIVCSDLTEQNDNKPLIIFITPTDVLVNCDVYKTRSCQRLIYTQTWTYSTLYPCTFPFTIFTDYSSHRTSKIFSQWFFSVHSFLSWYNIIIHIALKIISPHIRDVPLLFLKQRSEIFKIFSIAIWHHIITQSDRCLMNAVHLLKWVTYELIISRIPHEPTKLMPDPLKTCWKWACGKSANLPIWRRGVCINTPLQWRAAPAFRHQTGFSLIKWKPFGSSWHYIAYRASKATLTHVIDAEQHLCIPFH